MMTGGLVELNANAVPDKARPPARPERLELLCPAQLLRHTESHPTNVVGGHARLYFVDHIIGDGLQVGIHRLDFRGGAAKHVRAGLVCMIPVNQDRDIDHNYVSP